MKGLDESDAQQLLCQHAFLQPHPTEGSEDLLQKHGNMISNVANASDVDWETRLPQHYQNILLQKGYSSKEEIYDALRNSIEIEEGKQIVWLDQSTGKICLKVSARSLTIEWGDDDKYWRWVSTEDSRFDQVKELVAVWFFHVYHRFEFTLLSPNTHYTVAFVIKIDQSRMHSHQSPFEFSLQTTEGKLIKSARFLDDLERPVSSHGEFTMTPLIYADDGWMELVVGEFFLKADDGSGQARVVDVFMKNNNCNFKKSGVFLDGVKITPKTMNKSGEQVYRKSMDESETQDCWQGKRDKALEFMASPSLSHQQSMESEPFTVCTKGYDAFINHRGPDVKNFVASEIYNFLQRMGYRAFLDQPELKPGDSIPSTIHNAITTSTVQIAIFSPRYAESSWCLDELLLMLKTKALFIPVFCDVKPSDLRHPNNGVYAPAFAEHEDKRRFNKKKLRQWKAALRFSSNISGYEFSTANR
ncbi:hypothetical protein SUGI_0131180 [Cryptomeria japonica]|nr:hypothetical protein SUGI_0131180 [Cryptomeria japonica]